MWSRGLGKENLGLALSQANIKTFDEALAEMPEAAKERLLASVNGSRSNMLAVTGKISPPVGWEYVILLERKDMFSLIKKMISTKKLFKFIF